MFHIGFRNLKTTLAVLTCLILYMFWGRDGVIYACVASIICMQETIEKSIKFGWRRIAGTIIGGAFGIVFLLIGNKIHNEILFLLFISAGITILILFCNLIKTQASIPIAAVVYLIILLTASQAENSVDYALNRILDTSIGIIIAVIINFTIRPNKKQIEEEKNKQIEESQIILTENSFIDILKDSFNQFKNKFKKSTESKKILKEDLTESTENVEKKEPLEEETEDAESKELTEDKIKEE